MLLKSFGADMFVFPHKIHVDRDGNVWVVDERSANERERKKHPGDKAKGHTVVKFSPEGEVLLTIGTPGVPGNPPEALTEPTSVVVAPNGDIFIAEGHSGEASDSPPATVARISRFTKDGKFVKSFGKLGSGPAEFRTPHDITMDPQGRLWVADRGNMRIQILDQDGRFIDEWKQFSRPSGISIRGGMIYVADRCRTGAAAAAVEDDVVDAQVERDIEVGLHVLRRHLHPDRHAAGCLSEMVDLELGVGRHHPLREPRRRDRRHASGEPPNLGDPTDHLGARQVAARAGLGALAELRWIACTVGRSSSRCSNRADATS